MVRRTDFQIRRAGPPDVDDIAEAHLDSIRSIGPQYYAPQVVSDWGAQVRGEFYLPFMAEGETFFIAVGELGGAPKVLGFSSHRIDGDTHGVSVYVRGDTSRCGIGTAPLRTAEADATASGATSIHIEASLAAVEFYTANGLVEVGRGELDLGSGRPMACVFMRKDLPVP